MIALSYTIELLEPSLLTGLEGEPNSAVSLDYLPGSALRGAVIAAYLQTDSSVDILPFLDGRIRFLNGYPGGDNNRSLPLPLSLRRDKYEADLQTAYDQASEPLPEHEDLKPQWQNVGGGFARWDDTPGVAAQFEVQRFVTIHTSRERRAGRATEDEGAVFRYDALAAAQVFQAVVLCDTQEQIEITKPLLAQIARLGKSTRGGYGAVVAEALAPELNFKEHPWPPPPAGERQIVILLSEAILRDANGQVAVSPRLLADALSISPALAAQAESDRDFAFLDTVMVGGFNRKWGLPLPQEQAFRRGSVLMLPPDTLTQDDVIRLEAEGIGARREDGFGRLAVVAPCSTWNLSVASNLNGSPNDEILTSASNTILEYELAERIAKRVQAQRCEHDVRIRVSETLADTVGFRRGELKSSQIGRLREELRRELMNDSPKLDRITGFIRDLRPTAKKQFAAARVNGKPLSTWLEDQASTHFTVPSAPTIGGVSTQSDEIERMQIQAQLKYVDAVLARMAKHKEDL